MDDHSADVGCAESAFDCADVSDNEYESVGPDTATDTAGDTTSDTAGVAESDAELMLAARAGNREAFGRLYQRYRGMAVAVARRAGASHADADDAVAEAFTRIYAHLHRGTGPEQRFAQYLARAVRNAVVDRHRNNKRVNPHDDMEPYGPPVPFIDTAVGRVESAMAAAAFRSLPQRWRQVLWRVEIEGHSPAAVADEFGLTPNSVSALAMRAREGLRQAYLQAHLQAEPDPACRSVVRQLGKWARAALGKRDLSTVSTHLGTCPRCQALAVELKDINGGLRGIAAIVLLGGALAGGAVAGGGIAGGGVGGGGVGGGGVGGGGVGGGSTAGGSTAATAIGHRRPGSLARRLRHPRQAAAGDTAAASGHAALTLFVAAAAVVAGITAATVTVTLSGRQASPAGLAARTGIAIERSTPASLPATAVLAGRQASPKLHGYASLGSQPTSSPQPKSTPAPQHRATTGASGGVTPRAPSGRRAQPTSTLAAGVFAALNSSRVHDGLPPLAWSSALAGSALQHDEAMASAGALVHQLPAERPLTQRMQANGYPALGYRGENIANTSVCTLAGALVEESRMLHETAPDNAHRLNILSTDYRMVGLAVYLDQMHGLLWITEDFGS